MKIAGVSGGKKFVRYAHSYIGVGLTPFIGNELNKTKLNPFKEFFIVTNGLLKIKPVRLKVGFKTRWYDSIIFSNIDVMSKYLNISQKSSVTDGRFEVTIFKHRNKVRLIWFLLRATFRGVKEDMQVSSFSFKTLQKTLVQADGEIITLDGRTKAHIIIEQKALEYVL